MTEPTQHVGRCRGNCKYCKLLKQRIIEKKKEEALMAWDNQSEVL